MTAKEITDRWKGPLLSFVLMLVLAGVTATTSMVWQMHTDIRQLKDDQGFTMQSQKVRRDLIDSEIQQVKSKNEKLDKRIGSNRNQIEQNASRISVLQSRLNHLKSQ